MNNMTQRFTAWMERPLSNEAFALTLLGAVIGLIGFSIFTCAAIETLLWSAGVLAFCCLILAAVMLTRACCAYSTATSRE